MPTLEICIDTPAGLAAAAGGADRIELCAALALGGLTPSAGLVAAAVAAGLPVAAMIRPCEGDFRYDPAAVAVMIADIDAMAAAGVEGVVFGATDVAGALDLPLLAHLIDRVRGSSARYGRHLTATLHRAVDLCRDRLAAVDQAVALGFDRILTSGGATTAPEGTTQIAAMHARAAGRCTIVAGAGIDAANVAALLAATGVDTVHASCRGAASAADPRALTLGFGAPATPADGARVTALRQAFDTYFA